MKNYNKLIQNSNYLNKDILRILELVRFKTKQIIYSGKIQKKR